MWQGGGEDEMTHYEALGIKRMAKAVEIEVILSCLYRALVERYGLKTLFTSVSTPNH